MFGMGSHVSPGNHGFMHRLIQADFAAAAVMITFGAVLGKVSPSQLLIIGFLEVIFYGVNALVGVSYLKVSCSYFNITFLLKDGIKSAINVQMCSIDLYFIVFLSVKVVLTNDVLGITIPTTTLLMPKSHYTLQ